MIIAETFTTWTIGSEFKYRSIFTHGFLSGGYRGANPWRTVNQTFHATDVTICRGDQLDRAAAYVDGNFGDYNGYIYGGANGWSPNGPHTSSINLHTGTGRTAGSSPDYNHTDNYGTTPDSIGASWDLYDHKMMVVLPLVKLCREDTSLVVVT